MKRYGLIIFGFLLFFMVSCGGNTSSKNGANDSSSSIGNVIGSSVTQYDTKDEEKDYANVQATVTPYQYGFKILWHPIDDTGYIPLSVSLIQNNKELNVAVTHTKKEYKDNLHVFLNAGKKPIYQGYIESESTAMTYHIDTTWIVFEEAFDGSFDPALPYTIKVFNFRNGKDGFHLN